MTEQFNSDVRSRLAASKPGIARKAKKPSDQEELLARGQAALGELAAVLEGLAAAEPAEPTEGGEEA